MVGLDPRRAAQGEAARCDAHGAASHRVLHTATRSPSVHHRRAELATHQSTPQLWWIAAGGLVAAITLGGCYATHSRYAESVAREDGEDVVPPGFLIDDAGD